MGLRSTTIYASMDATIREDDPDVNYGTGTWAVGMDEDNLVRSVLFFDLSGLPPLSEIVSADLYITKYLLAPGTNSLEIDLYCLFNQKFLEYQVTWNNATTIKTWTTAGAIDSGQTPVAYLIFTPTDTTVDFDLKNVVSDWHKNKITNCGLIVGSTTETEIATFWNKSAATISNRPRLEIIYNHHETLSNAGKEKWRAVVLDPSGETIYDNNLEKAPEEIGITQQLPTEDLLLHNHQVHLISPWKGSDGNDYSIPFDDNTVDEFMFERSMIAREITLSWNVANHSFANLWQMWAEFGCTVYLYPGRRYDPSGSGEGIGILGVEGNNVWTDWPWIDPDEHIRLWKNDIEVYNSDFVGTWAAERQGGRIAEIGSTQSAADTFKYLCNYCLVLRPIEVFSAYHATYVDRQDQKKIAALQVICVEADYAKQQFGYRPEEPTS